MCRMTINLNNLRSLHVYEEEENELSRLQRWLKLGEKFSSDYKKLKDENDKLKRELEKSKSDSIRLAKISQYENTIQSLTNQISKLKMEVDTANQKAKVNEENVRSLRIENYNLQVDVNRKEVESSGNNRKLINQKTNLSSLNKKVREQAALIAKLRANRCYYCPNTDSDSD
jgi:chromosome segregation ATPase